MEVLGNTFYFDWEVSLMIWLQAHLGSFGEALANFFSMFGEEMLLVVILGFLYWCYDKEYGKFVGLNLLSANVWFPMIKNICMRRRPYMDNPQIACLRRVDAEGDIYDVITQGYSFPSGHSTAAAAAYGSLPAYRKKKTWLAPVCYCLIFLVGVSRFCLGVHYPTDVLAGWAVGFLAIGLIPLLLKKVKRRVAYLILILVALPGFFYCESTDYYTSFGMLIGYCLAIEFEEKHVNFAMTRSVLFCLLRIAGGAAIFFGLNAVLKLPFSSEFLENGTFLSHLVRTLRYTVVMFTDIGLYPMLFRPAEARMMKMKKK